MRDPGARARVMVFGALLGNPIEEPEYRRAFAALGLDRPDALIVSEHAEGCPHRRLIVELAAEARLPAIQADPRGRAPGLMQTRPDGRTGAPLHIG